MPEQQDFYFQSFCAGRWNTFVLASDGRRSVLLGQLLLYRCPLLDSSRGQAAHQGFTDRCNHQVWHSLDSMRSLLVHASGRLLLSGQLNR